MKHAAKPAAVQAITNLLDSVGGMRNYVEIAEPRAIIARGGEEQRRRAGHSRGAGGRLTNAIDRALAPDHAEARDFERARSRIARCAAKSARIRPSIAHRYALSMAGVDTVILGVKNRDELRQCLEAEARGALEPALMQRIDALGLRGIAAGR